MNNIPGTEEVVTIKDVPVVKAEGKVLEKPDMELFETRTEILGVDAADFILKNGTYLRIQILIKGLIKVIPSDLLDSIAKLIREYDVNKAAGIK
jgi:hypothetical protein